MLHGRWVAGITYLKIPPASAAVRAAPSVQRRQAKVSSQGSAREQLGEGIMGSNHHEHDPAGWGSKGQKGKQVGKWEKEGRKKEGRVKD